MFAVVQLYPLVWLVLSSFKDNVEITGGNVVGLPELWRRANYRYIMTATSLGANFLNSAIYSVATVVFSGTPAAMASYAITRMKWKGSKLVLGLFMTGLMIPVHATLLPVFLMLKTTKLLNTYWALIIPYTANALPGTLFIMTGFFGAIPRELEEAGVKIDGWSIYSVFLKIIMPLMKPALVTTAVFTFLATWNELMFANTMVNKSRPLDHHRGHQFPSRSAFLRIRRDLRRADARDDPAHRPLYILFSDQVQKSMISGAVKG